MIAAATKNARAAAEQFARDSGSVVGGIRRANQGLFTIRNRDPEAQDQEPEAMLSKTNLEFANDFNRYLDGVNEANRSRHRAAAIGYLISGLVAMASMGILLFSS